MKQMARSQVVDALRTKLMAMCDDEHSICEVAAQRKIFCHGFAQWTFTEMRKKYPTIVRSRPAITPQEMRELADRWQIARQTAKGTPMACDTQMHETEFQTCRGWDEWPDADLARFHQELLGEPVEIIARASA